MAHKVEAVKDQALKNCPNCLVEYSAEAVFCSRCGAKLELRELPTGSALPQYIEQKNLCSECNKDNVPNAKFCSSCGNPLQSQTPMIHTSHSNTRVEKYGLVQGNIALMILFSILTIGIYAPAWYLTRIHTFNSLETNTRLKKGILIIVIILLALVIITSFMAGVAEGTGDLSAADGFTSMSNVFTLAAWIILLFNAFRLRKMLADHFNDHLGTGTHFSKVATFFLHIYYLQYKINKLIEK